MAYIKRITNKDPLIEEKVNYFLDKINHAVRFAGWQWELELETPLSLLEKVLFRLQNDTEDRVVYFDNYFKRPFFASDTFWNDHSSYLSVKRVVAEYNKLGRTKKDEQLKIQIIRDPQFLTDLEVFYKHLKTSMSKDLLIGILDIVKCKHTLSDIVEGGAETHASLFTSIALVLVSQYFFHGFNRNEILQVISDVFSKEINVFPFPANVVKIEDREKHLAEKALDNQLHGFANAFEQEPIRHIIIIKVYGGCVPNEFIFKYNNVTFFGKEHQNILSIKQKMTKSDIDYFFHDGIYMLAAVEVMWWSAESLLSRVLALVRSEAIFLSSTLGRDFSVDSTSNYLILSPEFKYINMAWSSQIYESMIPESLLNELNDNPFKALRDVRGGAVSWFLKCEPLFVWANKNNSVSDYWLYLETLLSFNRASKQVKGIVSSIILINEHFVKNRRVLQTLFDIFCAPFTGMEFLNVTHDRLKEIFTDLELGIISPEIRDDYPFISELVAQFDAKLDANYYNTARQYYQNILTEAYGHRNFYVHKGLENEIAKAKLAATLPNMVIRLRLELVKNLKNIIETKSFDVFIDELVKQGNELRSITV